MKALTFQGKQKIAYSQVPDPSILAPTDAIVKVSHTAVCGSDLHVYHEREKGLDCGTVMGHEFVGEIVEVGSDIRLLKKGDRVVSPFTTNCGNCYYCNIGLTCRCQKGQLYGWVQDGKGLHGAQAQYVRVPLADHTLLTFDEHIDPEEALLIGDVRSTGYFCAYQANIQANIDGVYVVIGCGPVGLMCIIAAQELGAQQVYALDGIPDRLKLAEQFGATAINIYQHNTKGIIADATEGRGADAVMEAVGSSSASRVAYELVRPGGVISSVGVHTSTSFAFNPIEAYDKNITYKIGRSPARYFMQQLLQQTTKKYQATDIITHRFNLSEGVEAYRIFDNKIEGCIKVILKP